MNPPINAALWMAANESADLAHPNPFSRSEWDGVVKSLDGTHTRPVPEGGCAYVLGSGETPHAWDGESAGIALLFDGRWCAWETFWGPTGNGFNADAYGGTATIYVADNPEVLRRMALTRAGRALCGIPFDDEMGGGQ